MSGRMGDAPTMISWTTFAAVAPEIAEHEPPFASHCSQAYAYEVGAPLQLPLLTVSVCPSWAAPEIVGVPVLTGLVPAARPLPGWPNTAPTARPAAAIAIAAPTFARVIYPSFVIRSARRRSGNHAQAVSNLCLQNLFKRGVGVPARRGAETPPGFVAAQRPNRNATTRRVDTPASGGSPDRDARANTARSR